MGKSITGMTDGRRNAMALMRKIEALNWDVDSPEETAELIESTMAAAQSWSKRERVAFYHVIGNFLTRQAIGISYNLDQYENSLNDESRSRGYGRQ